MALIPRGSFYDLDKIFDDFWAPATRNESNVGNFFTPRVDIKELDDHYEVTAELPGIKKEDVHITLHDGILTLEAEAQQEEKQEQEGKIIRQERRYGKYRRSFNLGGNVEESDISAAFSDGVLKLKAPKAKPGIPQQRRIEIS
ncbi:Hsp20/alpha crystallin family protein [Pseudomaricurvus alcaniphilus]|uniref:Hsp20/alpha crystallin family protein n=1 Tax=Pseudomaricurvus alcaniphilus TaxID=1166482 RepID=UPI001407E4E5|nr:Hsp20/alpha crystallin family protein [Pseudomaricurvus alcaniphilus]NHN38004.1 Hsp20/alpha crystallin family protein [Pseudomaricurvus alcaniphilus]